MVHYDVQLIGGVAPPGQGGRDADGGGKTLVATLPLLNALTGRGVHLVTVNDYLARRDCEWMGPSSSSRTDRGLHRPAPAEFGAAPGGLPLRHRLRHQQRVRLRLPPGQHGHASGSARAAQAPLCHRGRGGQRPHRRGADSVDHLRPHTQGRRARFEQLKPKVVQLVQKQRQAVAAITRPRKLGDGADKETVRNGGLAWFRAHAACPRRSPHQVPE